MEEFRRFFVIPLVLMLSTLAWGRTVGGVRGPVRLDDADPAALVTLLMHDAANVRMSLNNRGEDGNPHQAFDFIGFEYPQNSGTDFLYSGGLWVGAVVSGQRRVSTASDGDNSTNEFWSVHITPQPAINSEALGDWWLSSCAFDNAAGHYYNRGCRGTDEDHDWTMADDRDGNGQPSVNWDGGYGFIGMDDDRDGSVDEEVADFMDDDFDGYVDEDTNPASDGNFDGNAGYDPEPQIDEDPIGDIALDHLDNDHDGLIDMADPDNDGDLNIGFLDDDNDGQNDEDGAALGRQDFLAVYQDSIQAQYVYNSDPGGHQPLEIEVTRRSYVLDDPYMADVVFIDYTVRNMSANTLDSVFFALFADPDIGAAGEGGDAASLDDFNYFSATHHMMVQYDNPTDADGWGPGVIGFQLVRVPVAWDDLRFSFRNFERVSGGDPSTNADKYALISSGTISPRSPQMGDWRMLMSFGANPSGFTLAPAAALAFTVAVIGAPDTTSLAFTAIRTAPALARTPVPQFVRPVLGVLPATVWLSQNYPNPFNPATEIGFELPQTGEVTLRVFDVTGRAVATLAQGRYQAGWHTLRFDGGHLASGVYFYTLECGGTTLARKMLLLK